MSNAFNLSEEEVLSQFVKPWKHGAPVLLDGRVWDPRDCKLTIYEGPRLSTQQRSFSQGWMNAVRFGENVTQEILFRPLKSDERRHDQRHQSDDSSKRRQRLTLWGNLGRLPVWLATIADVITVGGFIVGTVFGVLKVIGLA